MVKKNIVEIPPKAKLIISKERFSQQLKEQIEKGRELLNIQVRKVGYSQKSPFVYPPSSSKVEYDSGELEAFEDKKTKWTDYCLELLKSSFDIPNNEYYKEFENLIQYDNIFGSPDCLADYKKGIRMRTQNLESVLERIDLIPTTINGDSSRVHTNTTTASTVSNKNVFVVYGHDNAMKLEIVSFLSVELNLNPISLDLQPSGGKTIIEKFEKYAAEVGYAVVLMSPDDDADVDGQIFKRARQNVILELGYFIAKLGRSNLCIIQKGEVEIPSDIAGILHVKFASNWKHELLKELKNAGVSV